MRAPSHWIYYGVGNETWRSYKDPLPGKVSMEAELELAGYKRWFFTKKGACVWQCFADKETLPPYVVDWGKRHAVYIWCPHFPSLMAVVHMFAQFEGDLKALRSSSSKK